MNWVSPCDLSVVLRSLLCGKKSNHEVHKGYHEGPKGI